MKFFPNRSLLSLLLIATLATQSVKANATCDEGRLANAVEAELSRLRQGSKRATRDERDLGLALARLGRTERALQVVQPYVNVAGENSYFADESVHWRDEALRLSARRQAFRGNAEWALKTAARIRQPLSRADSLFAVARLYFRRSDKAAASEVVHLAATLVSQSKDSRVLSYAAWMLARAGDNVGARQFFAKARQIPANNFDEKPEWKTRTISRYQAKAGFYDEAEVTAGKQGDAIGGVVRVLEEAQQFERALKIAERFPLEEQRVLTEQDTLFEALKAGKREVVAKYLSPLYKRLTELRVKQRSEPYVELDAEQRNASDAGSFALFYAFIGENEKAKSLLMKPEVASTLYLNMMSFPKVRLQLPPDDLRDYLDKVIQDASQTLEPRDCVEVLLSIADLRKNQVLRNEAIRILRDVDSSARQELAASSDVTDSYYLLHIAILWRQLGRESEVHAVLSHVAQILTKQNFTIVFHMATYGFWPEALRTLQLKMPDDSSFYESFARLQTQKNGGDPLLWIAKLKSATNRASSLAGAPEGCEPQNAEERELVLSQNGYSSQG